MGVIVCLNVVWLCWWHFFQGLAANRFVLREPNCSLEAKKPMLTILVPREIAMMGLKRKSEKLEETRNHNSTCRKRKLVI
jgi:hypothetical protein